MSKTWKAILGVILIFIFGGLAGAFSASLYIHHKTVILLKGGPAALAEVFERRMTHNLGLDANQKQQIHDAFTKNLTQRMELQKTVQPQIWMLNRETMAEIDAVLNPEQQKKFDENIDQFKIRFGRNLLNAGAEDQSANPATNAVGQPPPAH
jgi:Spy/CpxP family protein refolding chaperone